LHLSPYYFGDRAIISTGTYSLDIHLMIENKVKPGMVCMDVGANIGEISLHLAKMVGEKGRVYAFEPIKTNFDRLVANVRRNNLDATVECFMSAVSNRTGRFPIKYADVLQENQGMASLVDEVSAVLTRSGFVESTTLDEFIKAYDVRRVDFIKADIQGAEILMLEGGAQCLAEFHPDMLIEVSPNCLESAGKTPYDLISALEAYGYDVFTFRKGRRERRISTLSLGDTAMGNDVYCTVKR
jgi:FkbM family methyltransferase